MCGFSAVLSTQQLLQNPNDGALARFHAQSQRLAHRGTDDARTVLLSHAWLSHHRLAFQDPHGSVQPQFSTSGDWVILFNGEIYNHLELRPRINQTHPHTWQTHGDTETLLAAYLAWGPRVIEVLEGEYAFVVIKTDGSEFFGARDPYGVKPLFFSIPQNLFIQEQVSQKNSPFPFDLRFFAEAKSHYDFQTPALFWASEMKGLFGDLEWEQTGCLRQFVGLYEAIQTPFQRVFHLPAGAHLHAKKHASGFFNARLTLGHKPLRSPFQSTPNRDLKHEFAELLAQSVEERLLSDVPLGVYLSGGIDSRCVAFELNKHRQLKSFTVGFTDSDYDETQDVKAYAKALGFTPHTCTLSSEHLTYSYPLAVYHSENIQPYTNGAAKWWLSLLARQHVSGVLTGDGADEVLAGYPSFRYVMWWKFATRNLTTKQYMNMIYQNPASLPYSYRNSIYTKRFASHSQNPWLSGSSAPGTGDDFLWSLRHWGVAHPLAGQVRSLAVVLCGSPEAADKWLDQQGPSIKSWFCYGYDESLVDPLLPKYSLLLWQNYFLQTHLPVQVLNWVGDRMEMANTLEGRTPFLSKKIRSFAFQLKDNDLIAGFKDKYLLRKAYEHKIGFHFAHGAKKQFGAPFLDNNLLAHDFPPARALEAAGLGDHKTIDGLNALLQNPPSSGGAAPTTHAFTHLQSAAQTLQAWGILESTLRQKTPPPRRKEFEQRVVSS